MGTQYVSRPGDAAVLDPDGLARIIAALRADGRLVVGPTVRDGAIVHAEIAGIDDLPRGWTDVQEAGAYRLARRADDALFGYAVGPHSWKPQFLPPRLRLWTADRAGADFSVTVAPADVPRLALIGARSCDLHAIAVQDRTLRGGAYPDPDYARRRADVFVVAVNCGTAGGTCFCVSMDTGPAARDGYDLALTEILDGAHRFLVEAGTTRGAEMLATAGAEPADEGDRRAAGEVVARTASAMGRFLDASTVPDVLHRSYEHPRWEDVAARCLTCANCTMVCPTCFCTTVEDVTDLSGDHAERWRRWDSCFTLDFSHVHGGSVRSSPRARYRQWLTHKLATWIDQFGTSGCVGCGRCITWCPVGIDLTEEVAAMAAAPADPSPRGAPDGDA
jgi:ferredoxin